MLWVGTALVFSVLFFVPGLFEQFETPKIEVVRICGLGALAFGLIAGHAGRPRRWRPLDWAVAAWVAAEVLTTLGSVSPRLSLVGETRQREGLLTSLALGGLYVAARDAFAKPGRVRAMLDLVLGLSAVASIYAMLQAAGLDPLQWNREAVYLGVYARPFATLGHPNLLAVLTAAAAPIALALALAGRRGAWRPWAYGLVAIVLLAVTALTLSRAAWLGAPAGLALAGVMALRERGLVRVPRRAWVMAVAGASTLAAIAFAGWGRVLAPRLAEIFSGGSSSSRFEIWRGALAAWRAHPIVGVGPDCFEMMFTHFQPAAYWRYEWTGLPVHAHSIYLHTLATRGAIGALSVIAWAAALAWSAVAAWRRRADPALAGLVPAGAGSLVALGVAGGFGALGITGALMVVLISATLCAAADTEPPADSAVERGAPQSARRRRDPKEGRGGATRPRPGGDAGAPPVRLWAARVAAAAVSLAATLWGITEMRASRDAAEAREFMTSAPPRAARASAEAIAMAPHDDRLWRMHAETLLWLSTAAPEPATLLGEAEAAARRAVALEPERAVNSLILARSLGAREAQGDTTARGDAEAAFRRSLALAPADGLNLIEYADYEALAGRPAPALEAARRVAALYPTQGEALAVEARALLAAGARDSARVILERALRATWNQGSEQQQAEQALRGLRSAGSPRP